jgi:phenylacetic acid degradation operon negative regulatory protein
MPPSVTPRNVVLNLVRVAPRQSLPVSRLVEMGDLFGFSSNALRVAVTRLTAEGLLDSDERGWYRLGPAAEPVQAHVEDWRRGEARMRPWKGEWLAVALGGRAERAVRRASLRALGRLGFGEGLAGLWLRPDNLALPFADTVERLRRLGLEDGAEPFRARDFDAGLVQRLQSQLWPARALQRTYERTAQGLARSLPQLEHMPLRTALVQSFLLGGEAIRVLATDPLLPEEIVPGAARRELTELMLRYDAAGHRLWRSFATRTAPESQSGERHAH